MFGGMSYGSVSLNVHRSIAMAAAELGTFMNTGEGGLHATWSPTKTTSSCSAPRAASASTPTTCRRVPPWRSRSARAPSPASADTCPARRSTTRSRVTRMIPQGTDALSPAPHHDIYSIEDLRQLIYALKEATGYKPISVKIAAVHNVAAIASGVVRAGADIVYLDGFRGGTGAAPTIIRDHVGIPIEIAIAAVDQRLRDEGIRNRASIVAAGGIRSSRRRGQGHRPGRRRRPSAPPPWWPWAATSARSATRGAARGASATQRPELTRRVDPEWGASQLVEPGERMDSRTRRGTGSAWGKRHRKPARQPGTAARTGAGQADPRHPGHQACGPMRGCSG